MPNRTTRDYEGCHTLQDALETTLQDEQEVVVDAL